MPYRMRKNHDFQSNIKDGSVETTQTFSSFQKIAKNRFQTDYNIKSNK